MSDLAEKYSFCPYCGNELSSKYVDKRDRLYCGSCKRVIWRNPVPSAAVAVIRGLEVLLIKRGTDPWKGEWSLPTGFLEIDESPRKAAVRELEEETSLKTEIGDLNLLEIISFPHPNKEYVIIPVYLINFSNVSGMIEAGSDAEKACFKRPEKLEESGEKIRKDYRDVIMKAISENQN